MSRSLSPLQKTWLGFLVLIRNLGGNFASAPGPQRRQTPAGTEYDYYLPRQPLGKTLVFAYGLALSGEKDPRAVQFAQALAATGVTVAVPHLPGLKEYNPGLADQAALRDLIATLYPTDGALALFGFSVGGGLALTAAADPTVAEMVNPLILFGAHYDFPDFPRAFADISQLAPRTPTEWDDYIWCRMVLAYRCPAAFDLTPAEQAELASHLYNSPRETMAQKHEFYARVLRQHDHVRADCLHTDPQVAEALAPRGKLRQVKAMVMLLHDPLDRLIPPSEAEKILAELQQRPGGRQKLLVTPWIAHINPRYNLNFLDLVRIFRMLGEIFGVN